MQAENMIQQYMAERVDRQIAWYNKKAAINKTYHYLCRTIIMTFSAAIPVIALVHFNSEIKDVTLGVLGAIVAVLSGMASLMSYQEKWTEYRLSAEELMHEKMAYFTKTEHYKEQGFDFFVTRVEEILKGERTTWSLNSRKSI